MTENNIVWQHQAVTAEQRAEQKKQKPCMIWFTGLSGAGKSTIANALEVELFKRGYHSFLLDADNVRHGLNKDLGFSDEGRVENIRRVGKVGKLMVDSGLIVLSAFISPFRSDRRLVRDLFLNRDFIEVHVSTRLNVCEARDPKSLYRKARAGEVKNFTGIDSPYEEPDNAEVVLNTGVTDVDECVLILCELLAVNGRI